MPPKKKTKHKYVPHESKAQKNRRVAREKRDERNRALIPPYADCVNKILPNEIRDIICSYLPGEDFYSRFVHEGYEGRHVVDISAVANFRLVCKAWASVGERHLVQHMHFIFTGKSFANLLNISRSGLAKYVRSISYEPRLLGELTRPEFERIRDDDGFLVSEGASTTKDPELQIRDDAWRKYNALREEQDHIQETSYDANALGQALSRFPALHKIQLISDRGPPTQYSLNTFDKVIGMEGLILNATDESEDHHIGQRALTALLLATLGRAKPIDWLEVHKLHWDFFEPSPLNLYEESFAHLRHLKLVLEADYGDEDHEDSSEKHKQLSAMLRSAHWLETLHLKFDLPEISPAGVLELRAHTIAVEWDQLTQGKVWPNLNNLSLQVITIPEGEMIGFLRNHAKSLKHLSLNSVWLSDASDDGFKKVFREVVEFSNLEKLTTTGYWGQDSGIEGEEKIYSVYQSCADDIVKRIQMRGQEIVPGEYPGQLCRCMHFRAGFYRHMEIAEDIWPKPDLSDEKLSRELVWVENSV